LRKISREAEEEQRLDELCWRQLEEEIRDVYLVIARISALSALNDGGSSGGVREMAA